MEIRQTRVICVQSYNMSLDQLNIRTEEIDEILGKTPNKIIRWGVTVIFLVIISLLTGSWFFKYPDKIKGEIEITTLNPPVVVVSKSTGKIDTLLVKNNQQVNREDLLAVIENPAHINDVLMMSKISDSLIKVTKTGTLNGILPYAPASAFELGELQNYFTNFITAYNNLAQFIQLRYYTKKIEAIKKQISDYQLYYNYSYDRKNTVKEDFQLSEKDYNRYKQLFTKNAIAESELDQAKSRYLNKKSAYENIRTQLANIKIQISQLKSNLIDLQLQQEKEQNTLLIKLHSAYKNLLAQLDIWENRYLLIAPVAGKCVFAHFRTKNQNITAGEAVMTIIPAKAEKIIGRMMLPVRGAGKVKTGSSIICPNTQTSITSGFHCLINFLKYSVFTAPVNTGMPPSRPDSTMFKREGFCFSISLRVSISK